MRNQKGITLIALVITIIVLLILAGVSIAMLTGDNGLLTKSRQAAVDNAIAAAKDEVSLAAQAGMSTYLEERYTNGSSTGTANGADIVLDAIDAIKTTKNHSTTITVDKEADTVKITYSGRSVVGNVAADGTLTWEAITGTAQ